MIWRIESAGRGNQRRDEIRAECRSVNEHAPRRDVMRGKPFPASRREVVVAYATTTRARVDEAIVAGVDGDMVDPVAIAREEKEIAGAERLASEPNAGPGVCLFARGARK